MPGLALIYTQIWFNIYFLFIKNISWILATSTFKHVVYLSGDVPYLPVLRETPPKLVPWGPRKYSYYRIANRSSSRGTSGLFLKENLVLVELSHPMNQWNKILIT